MKNIMILTIGVLSISSINAQNFEFLDINNIKARVNSNHYLFNDPTTSSAGYEYPKNSGKNTLFSFSVPYARDRVQLAFTCVAHVSNYVD